MTEEKAKSYLIEIVVMIVLIGLGIALYVFVIQPRLKEADLRKEFLQICSEWSTKYNCDPNVYGDLPENNSGHFKDDLCTVLYPPKEESPLKCLAICRNGCNPLGGVAS